MRATRPVQLISSIKLPHQRNYEIRERFKFINIAEEMQKYLEKWRTHLERLQRDHLLHLSLRYDQRDNQENDGETKTIL
jgi:hypothetical protein